MYRTNSLRRAGELVIDHRDSPGIPSDLAAKWAAQGIAVATGSTMLKAASYTCKHCNAQVIIRPERTRPREVCRRCMGVVCDKCSLWCRPFEALVEQIASGQFVTVAQGLLIPRTGSQQ